MVVSPIEMVVSGRKIVVEPRDMVVSSTKIVLEPTEMVVEPRKLMILDAKLDDLSMKNEKR